MDSISRKNRRKSTGHFKSYIGDNFQERAVDVPEEPIPEEKIDPFLFPDEIVIAEAHNVLKFATLKANQAVILGTLFITNFKISFVTASLPVDQKENELVLGSLNSDFLGLHDIGLTEIDSIYWVGEGNKKKRLLPSTQLPNKVQSLFIILKNFRTINFNFRLTSPKEDLKITNALIVHRHPKKIDLIYLCLESPPANTGIPDYRYVQDWEKELKRTKCPNWRVTKHNENQKPFPSLPYTFVVPRIITDNELSNAANHFKGIRPPTWCWGTSTGAALVRMAQVSPHITTYSSVENDLIKAIHKSHSQREQPIIFDLDRELPSIKTIQSSYTKLKELHSPENLSAFQEGDNKYLSRWQSSHWLSHVRVCLKVAINAAAKISLKNKTIILQENEARDSSCIISSLIQMILDPYARTIRGFHSLIQKDWVALGHPFASRLGHLRPQSEDFSPLWLLFLNCVHELSVEHDSIFEFSSSYLVSLWHSSYCSLHSTFMFDSSKEESQTLTTIRDESRSKKVYLWPVWSWWNRSEGPRLTFLQETLTKEMFTLKPAKPRDIRMVAVLPQIPGSSPQENRKPVLRNSNSTPLTQKNSNSSTDSQMQDILAREQQLEYEKKIRRKLRQEFLNVHYIQALIRPLVSEKGMASLGDPTAIAYDSFHRLRHLLGHADSNLPYDTASPTPILEVDRSLQFNLSRVLHPWAECFGLWISEPSLQIPMVERQRPTIEPSPNCTKVHWKIIHEIFTYLQRHYRIHCSKHAKWYG